MPAHYDGVLVATPAPTHSEPVRAALAAGVPVLCEKPLIQDPDVVRDPAEVAGTAGVPLAVGRHRCVDPAVRVLRAGMVSGEYACSRTGYQLAGAWGAGTPSPFAATVATR